MFEKQINHQLRALVIDKIKEEIQRLEKAAENAAKDHVADDGSKFVYHKQLKYFTSTHQNTLAFLIRQMHSSRGQTEQNLLSMGARRSRAYLASWPKQLQQALEQGSRMTMLSIQEQQEFLANQKAFVCAISLKSLNHYGLVIKEQCLTLNQLEGESGIACGPAALKKLIIGESRAKHSISSMTVSSSKTYMKKPLAINLIMIFWMFISTELSKARLRGPILRRQHYQRLSMRQSINIKMPVTGAG